MTKDNLAKWLSWEKDHITSRKASYTPRTVKTNDEALCRIIDVFIGNNPEQQGTKKDRKAASRKAATLKKWFYKNSKNVQSSAMMTCAHNVYSDDSVHAGMIDIVSWLRGTARNQDAKDFATDLVSLRVRLTRCVHNTPF